jgi:hypothetical protein
LIAKENEPQVQFASVYNRIITDGRGLGFFINNACEADAAFLKFFTGVSLKEKPENDLAVNIVKMFAHSSLSFNDWNDEEQSKFMETVKRIRTKSYDRFAGIKMESEKIQEEFGFLRLLDVNDFRFKEKMKTWGADGLLNIFKAMKREAKKAIANKEKANVEE